MCSTGVTGVTEAGQGERPASVNMAACPMCFLCHHVLWTITLAYTECVSPTNRPFIIEGCTVNTCTTCD